MDVVGVALLFFVLLYGGPALCAYVAHRIELERKRDGLPPETAE